MTALLQRWIAASIVLAALAYLAWRSWRAWRGWRKTTARDSACGPNCGCG